MESQSGSRLPGQQQRECPKIIIPKSQEKSGCNDGYSRIGFGNRFSITYSARQESLVGAKPLDICYHNEAARWLCLNM